MQIMQIMPILTKNHLNIMSQFYFICNNPWSQNNIPVSSIQNIYIDSIGSLIINIEATWGSPEDSFYLEDFYRFYKRLLKSL